MSKSQEMQPEYSAGEPCPGCAEFVRMQHDIASALGVDADTDSIDLHGRIYGAVSSAQPPAADVQMAMALISEVDCHLANAKWDKDATARRKLHQAHVLLAPTAAVSLKDAYAKWRESHAGWCLSGPPEFGECNCSGSTKCEGQS